jgi:O-antigen/teichoic acid export membrane protein
MQIGQTVGIALKWMMAARFAGQLITWVVTILVIRILTPDDYGLMALAMAFIGFLSLFEEIGLGSAIIQRERLEQRLLEQIFGLLIVLNLALYALIWVMAPIGARFFAAPELTGIMRVLGLLLIINAVGTLPDAVLTRRMDFRAKSVALFASMVSGSLLTLVLALRDEGVWSLVTGNLFMALVRIAVLQYYAGEWYPPRFRLAGIGAAVRFGGFITADRVTWYVYSQSDTLIIGKLLGEAILGFYSVGMHLASLPMQKIVGALNEIGFSAFSRLSTDRKALRADFVRAVRVMSLLAFPVFLGISSVAPEIVGIFLGAKWSSAVLPIQVLALIVPLRLLHTLPPSALYAIGRAEVSVYNNVIACLLMPASFAIGAHWGLAGVCLAWAVVYPLYFLIALFIALPVLGLGVGEYLRVLSRPALAAIVMYAAVYGLRRVLEGLDLPSFPIMLALVLLGFVVYATLALALQRQACIDFVALVSSKERSERLAAFDPFAFLRAERS